MATTPIRSTVFDDFLKELAPGLFVKPAPGEPSDAAAQIRIDVREFDGVYTVLAELPGVPKEDIHVSIDGGVVTLRAEVKPPAAEAGQTQKTLRAERRYGALSRSFQLPQEIDQAAASARCDNGVLQLTLPTKRAGGGQALKID